jgi:hypothetical protein
MSWMPWRKSGHYRVEGSLNESRIQRFLERVAERIDHGLVEEKTRPRLATFGIRLSRSATAHRLRFDEREVVVQDRAWLPGIHDRFCVRVLPDQDGATIAFDVDRSRLVMLFVLFFTPPLLWGIAAIDAPAIIASITFIFVTTIPISAIARNRFYPVIAEAIRRETRQLMSDHL